MVAHLCFSLLAMFLPALYGFHLVFSFLHWFAFATLISAATHPPGPRNSMFVCLDEPWQFSRILLITRLLLVLARDAYLGMFDSCELELSFLFAYPLGMPCSHVSSCGVHTCTWYSPMVSAHGHVRIDGNSFLMYSRRMMCDYHGPVWSSSTEPFQIFGNLEISLSPCVYLEGSKGVPRNGGCT